MSGLGCIAEGHAGSPEEIQLLDERQHLPLRRLSRHRRGDRRRRAERTLIDAPLQLWRRRAAPTEAIAAAAAGGRYIAGGTTLIDLMREEVERPERLIDINALPLGGVRVEGGDLVIGALARMAEVAADPDVLRLQPLIAETPDRGRLAATAQHGLDRRQPAAARPLPLFPDARRGLQQARPGLGLRRDRWPQCRPRDPRHERPLRRDASFRPRRRAGRARRHDAGARARRASAASRSRSSIGCRATRRISSIRCCPAS